MSSDKNHPIKKYSKKSTFYRSLKKDFFDENKKNLDKALKQNSIYNEQPFRKYCKLCGYELRSVPDFKKHNVNYVFCDRCDHLNGVHQDTLTFANQIYTSDDGNDYSQTYLTDDYNDRIKHIYKPKAEFLKDCLGSSEKKIYDFGCGLGHFVNACISLGFETTGCDVSKIMVTKGNELIFDDHGVNPIELIKINETSIHLSSIKTDIISAIHVIEHISDLGEFFTAVNNAEFDYFYYAVPTYGLSVTLENVFEDVFPRLLSCGHTHLFTEKSLKYLHNKLNIEPIAEWRFGTDMMDLKRSIEVSLKENGASPRYIERFQNEFLNFSDSCQSSIDKSHNCSEIHVLCKKL